METSLRPMPQKVLVRFDSTLPGQPLAETVWDNAAGPFVDVEESNQIGYTQDYDMLTSANPDSTIGGALFGNTGAAVEAGMQPEYTRIVIPFGRIFQETFESGLQKVFPNSQTCSNDSAQSEKLRSAAPEKLVRLTVTKFKVWEMPLNHLNLKATIECKLYEANAPEQQPHVFTATHKVASQSVGSVMSTSSGFIREINKISNKFAGVLAEQILKDMQAQMEK